MKFRRNLFPSRPIFYLNSVNGQPSGSKSDFSGLSRVGVVPGRNCILRSPVPELSINSIPDGWKKCPLGIEMGGLLLLQNGISWKSSFPMKFTWIQKTSILYWNSLDFFHPGSGVVIGSLPGSCRMSRNSIFIWNYWSKWTSEGTGWRRGRA